MARNDILTPRKRRAIVALLTEPNVKAAAKAAKVAERTLHRWLKEDSGFQAALAAAEAEVLGHTARIMATHADRAVGALLDVLEDREAKPGERIQAARAFLAALPTLRLLASVEVRLAELLGEKQWGK